MPLPLGQSGLSSSRPVAQIQAVADFASHLACQGSGVWFYPVLARAPTKASPTGSLACQSHPGGPHTYPGWRLWAKPWSLSSLCQLGTEAAPGSGLLCWGTGSHAVSRTVGLMGIPLKLGRVPWGKFGDLCDRRKLLRVVVRGKPDHRISHQRL